MGLHVLHPPYPEGTPRTERAAPSARPCLCPGPCCTCKRNKRRITEKDPKAGESNSMEPEKMRRCTGSVEDHGNGTGIEVLCYSPKQDLQTLHGMWHSPEAQLWVGWWHGSLQSPGPAGRGRHTAGASRLPALRTPAGSRRAAALLGYLHLRQQQSCAVAARFTFYPLIKESAFVGYTIICGP